MLRHKKTLGTSLYWFGKKLSFCDAKQFHLTRLVLLRKVGAAKKLFPESNSFTETVAGEVHVESNFNGNKNFYGIESDEGVIDIEQRSRNIKLEQDMFINRFNAKHNKERLKNARFGTIRFDNENKPRFHGNFESTANSDSNMDNLANDFEMYGAVADHLRSPNASINKIQSRNIPSIESNDTNNRVQIQTENREPEIFQSTDKASGVSYVDSFYFPSESIEAEAAQNTDNASVESFIDSAYFPKETLNDNANEIPVSAQSEISNYPDHGRKEESYSTSDKGSFLDELYFSNEILDAGKNVNTVGSFPKASIPPEVMNKSHSRSSGNFRDESSFENQAMQRSNDYSNRNISTPIIKEKGFSFIDESFFDNLKNENVDSVKDKVESRGSNVTNSLASNLNENFDEVNHTAKTVQNKIKQFSKDHLNYSGNGREYENNRYTNFTYGNHNAKTDSYSSASYDNQDMPLNPTQDNFLQSPNTSYRSNDSSSHNTNIKIKDFRNDPLKTNLSENITDPEIGVKKHEHPQSKSGKAIQETKKDDLNSGDEIETAHDFISKLRAEKKQYRPLIKGGKIMPSEEKKDSKGFRILSNQVPKLSYFTRDEILTVLRNSILYSDDDIVVLNKPYNLVMHESKTSKDPCLSQYLDELASQLDVKNRDPKLITVHRIDKETCGCLVLARNELSAQRLLSLFAQRKIIKTYWIVTIAVPDPLEGVLDIPIAEGSVDKKSRMVLHPNLPSDIAYQNHSKHGKRAVTHYRVISTSGSAALVEVNPETGIKHQIRVHFGFGLSCPILGDHKYSHLTKMVPQKLPSDLLQRLQVRQSKVRHIPMHIYARSITIPQYSEGKNLFVMAPMPTHISVNLQRLKFRKK